MLFNTIEFAVFLPIIFVLYWLITNQNLKFQNLLLLTKDKSGTFWILKN